MSNSPRCGATGIHTAESCQLRSITSAQREKKKGVYVSLAIDTVSETWSVTGLGVTPKDCQEHHKRTEAPYRRSFLIGNLIGDEMFRWFREVGLPTSESQQLVRDVSKFLYKEFSDRLKAKHE